ncbi:MAG: NAD-dependent epimerase/dehydratase family protein [Patescibacteria group bacterium]|nr:NAD-dependent epimerase/dehydratase family protein [Patescibacteria group bacterium]
MNILITGGAGFIGFNLVQQMLKTKNRVFVVDSMITGSSENYKKYLKDPNYKFYQIAIESAEFLKTFSKINIDRIYNLACPTGPPNIKIYGEEIINACTTGMQNTLKLAKLKKAKYVYTSSAEIYGKPLYFPQAENDLGLVDPQGWRANYEEGKRIGETILAMYVDKYDVNALTVRFFNTYGPGMSLSDTRVVPRFIKQALLGEEITIQGDGTQSRALCYVDDSVKGLILAMEKGKKREIYNIGGKTEITVNNLANLIIKMTKSKSKIKYIYRPNHDSDRRLPNTAKIESLGWKQTIDLKEGLKRMIENFRERIYKQKSN